MKYYAVSFTFSHTSIPSASSSAGDSLSKSDLENAWDILAAIAGEAGFESFTDISEGTVGYIQQDQFNETFLRTLLEDFPMQDVRVTFTVSPAEDRDWNETWEKAGFQPVIIGDKCVIHDTHNVSTLGTEMLDITIDARQAFGTATHPTTRMIIEMLLQEPLQGKRVLDCGCGTGILGIVSAKAGAKHVVAYDIDEWSVQNTRHNAKLNHIDNIQVFHGDANVLTHVSGLFHYVLANINRNILLQDMQRFRDVMHLGAKLILSGFYTNDGMQVAACAGHLGLKLIKTSSSEDWCCLMFQSEN